MKTFLAWARIRPKTLSWSPVTRHAASRSGTFLHLHWTFSLRWAALCMQMRETDKIHPKSNSCFSVASARVKPPLLRRRCAHKSPLVCGSPRCGWPSFHPHSIHWWFSWTVDEGRSSRGLFWTTVGWSINDPISDPASFHRWGKVSVFHHNKYLHFVINYTVTIKERRLRILAAKHDFEGVLQC